jgi:hypothetical protein
MMVMGLSNLNWAEARVAEKRIKKPIKSVTFHLPIGSSFEKDFKNDKCQYIME